MEMLLTYRSGMRKVTPQKNTTAIATTTTSGNRRRTASGAVSPRLYSSAHCIPPVASSP